MFGLHKTPLYRIKLDQAGYCLTVRTQDSNNCYNFGTLQDLIEYLCANCERMNIPYPPLHPICPNPSSGEDEGGEDEVEEEEEEESEDELSDEVL